MQGLILPRGQSRRTSLARRRRRETIAPREPPAGLGHAARARAAARAREARARRDRRLDARGVHARGRRGDRRAGEADVGFGIQAAAAQLGLAFVPLAEERYAFACRRRDLADPRVRAFRTLIASPTVAKSSRRCPATGSTPRLRRLRRLGRLDRQARRAPRAREAR
jgi:hypothetical protein